MTDFLKKKGGGEIRKKITRQAEQWESREGRSRFNQGPDTLTVFVRNSKGCEDTHEPVRDG
jgi:hypothetical protein